MCFILSLTVRYGQQKKIPLNLQSLTETGSLAFKILQRDSQEFLDGLSIIEIDNLNVETFLLLLVETVNDEQFLLLESKSILIALFRELYFHH